MSVKEKQKKLTELPEDGLYDLDCGIEIIDVVVIAKQVFTVRITDQQIIKPYRLTRTGDL